MSLRYVRIVMASATISTMALAVGTTAHAQVAAGAADTAAEDGEEGAAIVVTGSRIARPGTDSPNPVVAVTAERIESAGTTNVTDYLRSVPALVGSSSSFDNSGSRAGIGYTGLNLLDLRNLGFDRTLVLVDGRRHIAGVDGLQSVDVNTIATDLIDRVEVLTGGASAIYGADGVSGVVNFIQKRDFSGITARAQAGLSEQGDAGQRLIAVTVGHNFADDRGNIAVSWEHSQEDRLQNRDRRRFAGSNQVLFYLNSADTETGAQNNDGIPDRVPLRDVRYFDTSREGGIDVDFDGLPDFVGAQGLRYDNGTFVPDFYQQGGSGTLVSDYGNDLLPRIKRDIVSGIGHFAFSDAFEVYAEAKYAKTRSYTLGQPTFDYYLFVPEDNPFIPAAVRPFIDPANGGVLVNRDNFDLGQRGEDITRETVRTVIGARGDLSDHLKYDVSYVFGRAKITNHYIGDILSDRFFAAIDSVRGPNGVTCRINVDPTWTPNQPFASRTVVNPTTFKPGECVPLNLFGDGVNSQAALDFVQTDTTDRSRLTQHVVSGALTGDTGSFLNMPGGPIGFAVGGEYRRESSSFTADPLAQQGLTFTNVLGNSKGSFHVKEAFAEVSVPIIKNSFINLLEVNGAYRVSDYSTIGKTTAWRVGGELAPVRDVSFRGTYSKAVRAPNISELFGAQSQTFEFIDDPCSTSFLQNGTQFRAANCQALLTSLGVANPAAYSDTRSTNLSGFQGGNPNIREETAKTWTAGVVLQPSFIPRLVLTADWYDIRIKNAINTVAPQTVADLCVDQPTLDNQYCAAIGRTNGGTTAGFINTFNVGPLNVANFKTAGLDVMLDYTVPTERLGAFNLHVVGNYLNKLTFVPIPGSPTANSAYVANSPKYQVTTELGWKIGAFSLDYRIEYFSKTYRYSRQTVASNPDIVAPEYLKYKERFQHDIRVGAEINDQFEIYTGVRNLFDQKPSIGSLSYPTSAVGRFLYVGARVKLADLLN